VWIGGDQLRELVGKRRPFLTAKRLLTNQTFRDIYRTDCSTSICCQWELLYQSSPANHSSC
jgi:hypothetical protein